MTIEQTSLGRSILTAGRNVITLADVCAAYEGVPASVLAQVLCRCRAAGLLRVEVPADCRPTVQTTELGLELLAALEHS